MSETLALTQGGRNARLGGEVSNPGKHERIRSMACRLYARNARRNPERAFRWERIIARYEPLIVLR